MELIISDSYITLNKSENSFVFELINSNSFITMLSVEDSDMGGC